MNYKLIALICVLFFFSLFASSSAQQGGFIDVPGEPLTAVTFQGSGVFGIDRTDVGWVLLLPDEFFTYMPPSIVPPSLKFPPQGGGEKTACQEAQERLATMYALLTNDTSLLRQAVNDPDWPIADVALLIRSIEIIKAAIAKQEQEVQGIC